MSAPLPIDARIELAGRLRALLDMADALELRMVAIHVEAALTALGDRDAADPAGPWAHRPPA
ncbi:MAG: hypothetical protein ACRYFW_09900 [Janthinobacterium lividum]